MRDSKRNLYLTSYGAEEHGECLTSGIRGSCKFWETKSAATSLIRAAAGFEEKSAAARQQVLLQSVLLQVLRTKRKG